MRREKIDETEKLIKDFSFKFKNVHNPKTSKELDAFRRVVFALEQIEIEKRFLIFKLQEKSKAFLYSNNKK